MTENCRVNDCQKRPLVAALDAIWKIVHTPTKLTRHRTADDHFQADFDSIRKIIADTCIPQEIREGSDGT